MSKTKDPTPKVFAHVLPLRDQAFSFSKIGLLHLRPLNRAKSASVVWSRQLCSTARAAKCASEARLPVAFPSRSIRWKIGQCSSVDRKSTRLNSSHVATSYAVFCLKKKKT